VTSRTQLQLDETVAAINAAGGKAIGLEQDVTVQADWDRVVAETTARLGPITLLVANAALSDRAGPVYEADPDVWARTLDVNVMGTLRGSRAVLPGMIERGAGRIIVINSGSALTASPYTSGSVLTASPYTSGSALTASPYTSSYRVSKTALLRLAEIMALEVMDHGVSVFSNIPNRVYKAEGMFLSDLAA
jgi:NAD(P)-dependent dehydrogenase (short-subunit alcohol dehydrogenase family)